MTTLRFIALKLGGALLTLFLAVSLAFFISRLSGDPTTQILGGLATQDQIAAKQAELGLDRPLLSQYWTFITDLLQFDLGRSLRFNRGNWEVIQSRIMASFLLAGSAMVLGVVFGVPLGMYAAAREGKRGDRIASAIAVLGQSMPVFWLGMVLVLVFSVRLGWFPAGQSGTWKHLVLPAVSLSTIPMARVTRLTRSSMSEVLEEPYIAAARARGLGGRAVMFGHALKNSALPVITLIGLQAGTLLSGAVTVEAVFAWPGLGSLATQAVQFRDAPLVQALVIVGAVAFVAINLVIDLLYGLIDPRIRDAA